jgi:hypothetical protein
MPSIAGTGSSLHTLLPAAIRRILASPSENHKAVEPQVGQKVTEAPSVFPTPVPGLTEYERKGQRGQNGWSAARILRSARRLKRRSEALS